jgi:hypothetical protein
MKYISPTKFKKYRKRRIKIALKALNRITKDEWSVANEAQSGK